MNHRDFDGEILFAVKILHIKEKYLWLNFISTLLKIII